MEVDCIPIFRTQPSDEVEIDNKYEEQSKIVQIELNSKS